MNLRKNALDVGKIPKSFILTTTFFNSAFILDEYNPINRSLIAFLKFKIEKIYFLSVQTIVDHEEMNVSDFNDA